MENNQSGKSFQYTYSAKEQEEIKAIRSRYMPREESKMDRLRMLDRGASRKATVRAITVGLAGTLLLGIGMSCTMTIGGGWFILGIVIGMVGIAVLGLAYPVYCRVLKTERERVAPEILRLTDELMK